MVDSPSQRPGAAEALLPILAEIKKDNTNSLNENITTKAAEILLQEGLGLGDHQFISQYKCDRVSTVDFAVSYVNSDFSITGGHPQILLELKKPGKKFVFGTKSYFEVVDQLKRYMNARSCETVEHGIIFNACQIQVFRKHCKLIYPVTDVIDLIASLDKRDNYKTIEYLKKTIQYIRRIVIDQPRSDKRLRGTIITVWNNKGGVGKTTTAFHLSLLLSDSRTCPGSQNSQKAKVLAIDFDHDNADLTKNFKCSRSDGKIRDLFSNLNNGNLSQSQLQKAVEYFPIKQRQAVIHLLAADRYLCGKDKEGRVNSLEENQNDINMRKLCLRFAEVYDYIVIDAPPNRMRDAISAADCLLPIAEWGNKFSLLNYYDAIREFLPDIRLSRKDGGPENLGLWINKSETNNAVYNETIQDIKELIDRVEKDKQEQLRRAFGFGNEQKLQLIKKVNDIRKIADIITNNLHPFRVPWLRRPQAAYQPLLDSIV